MEGILDRCPLPREPIPRYHYSDPNARKRLDKGLPVVLTETQFISPACDRWTPNYLLRHMGQARFIVFESDTSKFMYHDDSKNANASYRPPSTRLSLTFQEFMSRMEELSRDPTTTKRVYLQQMLSDQVGPEIVQDFLQFNWRLITQIKAALDFGDLTTNMLLVGMKGVFTPAHYDEQQNFFAQAQGRKRVVLISPDYFAGMYPFPVSHPCDRQSQVDWENPNYERFPKFRKVKGMECVLMPGEVLYIPAYWWHAIESLDETVSVNFWYKVSSSPEQIVYPLNSIQKVAMTRNIEKMLGGALGDPSRLDSFLHMMVDGRFPPIKTPYSNESEPVEEEF